MGIFPRTLVIFFGSSGRGYSRRLEWTMVKKLLFRLVLPCLLAACASDPTLGQTTGRMAGVVKDPSGAVVAKADVHAVNEATNESWSTTTGQAGDFSFF